MMQNKRSSGRSVFEMMIIMIFIGILVSVAITRFMRSSLSAKEALLRSELANIRMSIKLYEIVNGKYPDSLIVLEKEQYLKAYSDGTSNVNLKGEEVEEIVIIEGDYLKATSVDEEGSPLDPFGEKYSYNNETGRIKSLTKGYESW